MLACLPTCLPWLLPQVLVLGPIGYFSAPANAFDAVIVAGSIIELVLFSGSTSSLGALRLVRMLRLLRVARLTRAARKNEALKTVLRMMYGSASGMWPCLVLLLLFLFVLAILGMQLFGPYTMHSNNDKVRVLLSTR